MAYKIKDIELQDDFVLGNGFLGAIKDTPFTVIKEANNNYRLLNQKTLELIPTEFENLNLITDYLIKINNAVQKINVNDFFYVEDGRSPITQCIKGQDIYGYYTFRYVISNITYTIRPIQLHSYKKVKSFKIERE